jgi:hypothetical protein
VNFGAAGPMLSIDGVDVPMSNLLSVAQGPGAGTPPPDPTTEP